MKLARGLLQWVCFSAAVFYVYTQEPICEKDEHSVRVRGDQENFVSPSVLLHVGARGRVRQKSLWYAHPLPDIMRHMRL